MLEHTPLDSSDLSIQHGEIRKTWHADSVFCILEGISWWQVRSRVIESHSANAKVGDILNWTETRWKWFESRSSWEGAYEILSMIWAPTTAVEEIWEEGWWDKDTTLPDAPPAPATDISGAHEAILTPDEAKAESSTPSEQWSLPQDIQKIWWNEQHFAHHRWMVRLSQVWKAKLTWLSAQAQRWIIEQFETIFEEYSITFISGNN